VDNHFIWRVVGNNFAALQENAPAGLEPVVEVHVLGADAPIPISKVETHREQPWIMLHSPEGGSEAVSSDWYVFVHEDRILRIEIAFHRKGKAPIGFAHEELEREGSPMVSFG
jgi:hypothetical protein